MHPMYDDSTRGDDRRSGQRGPRFGGARQHHGAGFPGRGHHGGRGGFGPGFGPGGGFGPGFGGFGPMGGGFGRDGRRARRGDVRLAILGLLAEGPQNGYAIIKTIAERTGGAWKPSPGSVYPTLQQLVDEDLVETTGDGRKSSFELTEAGRAEAADKADEIAAAWETSPGFTDTQREFIDALRKTMGVLHMYRSNASEEQAKAATAKIDQLRKDLLQILAD